MSAAVILGTAIALPFLIKCYISRSNGPARTTQIPQSQERIVVIGASSGIGSELARIYAHRKAHVVLVARRMELLQQLVQELRPVAGSVHAVQGDVTLPEDVRRITIEALKALEGGIDTLIICAGIISVLPFAELAGIDISTAHAAGESKGYDDLVPTNAQKVLNAATKIMNVNYHAPLNLTTHFLPALKRTSVAGNIIVVSSMAGKIGAPTRSIYCASKHAAQGFFESLGMEIEKLGIHVGIVSPGTVATDLRQSAVDLPTSEMSSAAASASASSEPPKKIAGTKKGAMTARACAEGIVQCSDTRQHEAIMPWFYHASLVLQIISPGLVRWLAKKKYGYL